MFVLAGITKLCSSDAFARKIGEFGIVPEGTLLSAAIGLAVLEVASGGALALGSRLGLHAVTGLLLLFLGVLGYGIAIGLDIDCACLALAPEDAGASSLGEAIVRDLVMLAACAYLYLSPMRRPVAPGIRRSPEPDSRRES